MDLIICQFNVITIERKLLTNIELPVYNTIKIPKKGSEVRCL